ncbi:hypothetical protein K504DRAFT_491159 [Pleomassaria siparia CBS 279.74]|uniref:Uncharacterized protein n=1 Tax=Pleomassaria siparia CBS 279.74 TaxID=1314801 RepID=A0A6G1KB81_9PLEO|nr:hypothetical protein K504DRAFT_491159 [Pleomassaria siparia CBS 279.74]
MSTSSVLSTPPSSPNAHNHYWGSDPITSSSSLPAGPKRNTHTGMESYRAHLRAHHDLLVTQDLVTGLVANLREWKGSGAKMTSVHLALTADMTIVRAPDLRKPATTLGRFLYPSGDRDKNGNLKDRPYAAYVPSLVSQCSSSSELAPVPCDGCAAGQGSLASCRVDPNHEGACLNCWHSRSIWDCSLHNGRGMEKPKKKAAAKRESLSAANKASTPAPTPKVAKKRPRTAHTNLTPVPTSEPARKRLRTAQGASTLAPASEPARRASQLFTAFAASKCQRNAARETSAKASTSLPERTWRSSTRRSSARVLSPLSSDDELQQVEQGNAARATSAKASTSLTERTRRSWTRKGSRRALSPLSSDDELQQIEQGEEDNDLFSQLRDMAQHTSGSSALKEMDAAEEEAEHDVGALALMDRDHKSPQDSSMSVFREFAQDETGVSHQALPPDDHKPALFRGTRELGASFYEHMRSVPTPGALSLPPSKRSAKSRILLAPSESSSFESLSSSGSSISTDKAYPDHFTHPLDTPEPPDSEFTPSQNPPTKSGTGGLFAGTRNNLFYARLAQVLNHLPADQLPAPLVSRALVRVRDGEKRFAKVDPSQSYNSAQPARGVLRVLHNSN